MLFVDLIFTPIAEMAQAKGRGQAVYSLALTFMMSSFAQLMDSFIRCDGAENPTY